jgi:hypothetical protein
MHLRDRRLARHDARGCNSSFAKTWRRCATARADEVLN